MSKTSHTNEFFGVDRAVVDAAILRGRQERSQALRALVRGLFGRPETRQSGDTLAACHAGNPAHC